MKKRQGQNGFSLIELSIVVGVSVLIASGVVGMFNFNLQMLNQAVRYQFVAKDAPFIGLLLTRTIGNAEDYRIYASRAAATSANGAPVLTGPAVRLWMAQPGGTYRQAVLSFETIGGRPTLYFFPGNEPAGGFSADPPSGLR